MLFCRDMDEEEDEETSHCSPRLLETIGRDIFEDVDAGDPATENEFVAWLLIRCPALALYINLFWFMAVEWVLVYETLAIDQRSNSRGWLRTISHTFAIEMRSPFQWSCRR